jgi:autotransporter-associated beta strand protein
MRIWSNNFSFLITAALLFLTAQRHSFAGSATWSSNPLNGDWNTASNWTPNTVPNSPSDVASFGSSNQRDVTVSAITEVAAINFSAGAGSFNITSEPGDPFFISGTGIINDSGLTQTFLGVVAGFLSGGFVFENNATAGEMTSFSTAGGIFAFNDTSSAGSATFDVSDSAQEQADLTFSDFATAANATITANGGALVGVFDNSTGADATFTLSTGGFLIIGENATADHAIATCIGGNQFFGSSIQIQQFGSAAQGYFTTVGASSGGEFGSYIEFDDSATAANGTFVINGGTATGLAATQLIFDNNTTAAAANITANGGVGGSEGGAVIFDGNAAGGTASISLFGNGELDIGDTHLSGVTIGSLSGDGLVFLGTKTLTIGSNNQSTTFSGVIQESGSLTKIGTGTLVLSGSNTYTGTTTVNGGVLNAANKNGSATGTGAVQVNTGTLGGRGIIAGPTIIGSGSGAGAFLAPAVGTNKQTTLTIQSAVTLNSDATYTYTFKAKQNKARSDKVIANGVTITGATLDLVGTTQGSLKQGLTLTVISNTSASPISGTFANLPDGGIVTVNGNNFQATYSGGDGNDLTLTVVP